MTIVSGVQVMRGSYGMLCRQERPISTSPANISRDERRDFFPEGRSRIEDMFGRCWQRSPIACYDPSLQSPWSPSDVADENLERANGPMNKLFEKLLPHRIVDAGHPRARPSHSRRSVQGNHLSRSRRIASGTLSAISKNLFNLQRLRAIDTNDVQAARTTRLELVLALATSATN